MSTPIGQRIRALRKERGWTQKQLGDLCGMADSAIRYYESGKGNLTEKTLSRFAAAFKVSVPYLLGQEKDNVIIPGRLTIRQTDDPNSDYYTLQILAADEEAFALGKQILEGGGVEFNPLMPQVRIVEALSKLNDDGIQAVADYVEYLAKNPRYTVALSDAPQRPQDATKGEGGESPT